MSGIMEMLNSDLGKQIIGTISEKTGIDATQASSVLANGLPAIMSAMQNNVSGEGASGLLAALSSSKHDGSILDNVSGFLKDGDFTDGSKILGHVLGGKEENMVQGLSSKTGVDSGIIAKILPMLAPIVMGYLGKQTKKEGVSNSSDLSGMLGGILGGLGDNAMLTSVLDQNGDGKLDASDAMEAFSGKKKGGLAGMLGGLFGKK